MKLTAKARYAVTAMADIARFGESGAVTLAEIAGRQKISQSFLEQLFRKLREAGLVTAQRGTGGGYALAMAADDICVGDIVRAVDAPVVTTACSPEALKGCTGTHARCLTHDLWDELGRHIDVFLSAISLQDILDKRVLGRAAMGEPVMKLVGGKP